MTVKPYHYLRRSIDPRQEHRRWIDPRFRTLRIEEVISYLLERGWRELPPDRPACRAFQEPPGTVINDRPVCQFVPDSEAYDDYGERMFELLTGLAEFEDRQAREVIDNILGLAGQGRDGNGLSSVPSAPAETAS